MKKQMKITLALLLTAASSVSLAYSCRYCRNTMPLRLVNGRYYCNKHYCSKHKETHSTDKCYQCELASRVSRGKAKCVFCDNTKKLTIAKGRNKYEAFCPDHYCTTHTNAFYEPYSGSPYCLKCRRAALAQEAATRPPFFNTSAVRDTGQTERRNESGQTCLFCFHLHGWPARKGSARS